MLRKAHAIAGSPQRQGLVWTHLKPCEVSRKLREQQLEVSSYVVAQVYRRLNLRRRKMHKANSLKEVEHRNEQFENIAGLVQAFLEAGLPVLSIDTKKKELLGDSYRSGFGYGSEPLRVNDHDFASFSQGLLVPHGIYDVGQNRGYLTLGVSKDTSAFVCDNLHYFWQNAIQWHYPQANMALLLCDGGGSNSCRHHIFKQDLYRLAQMLQVTFVVAHYPAYCSKWNPIEHRFF